MRNRRNGSFYRFVRPEGQRVRIRPLELFPNGLLIEKTADTIVDSDLQVDMVAEWTEEVYVEVPENVAAQLRVASVAQLEQKQAELVILEAEMITMDPKGRGSHANRIKACRWRVEVLTRGLAEPTQDISSVSRNDAAAPHFDAGTIVQLPSGQPGKVESSAGPVANILTHVAGIVASVPVPMEILRPWHSRSIATI